MTDQLEIQYMADAQGRLVPTKNVKPEHVEEDALVKALFEKAEKYHDEMASFKQDSFDNIGAFRELIAEQYAVTKGGKKGNITLSSYDGRRQIKVAVQERIAFGPELEAAKALIDECVLKWSKDSGAEIKALVEHAFQTNKEGRIDTQRVLSLRRLDIKDETWQRAMNAIADALRITGSSTYLNFYKRDEVTGAMRHISLDFAKL